MADKGHWVGTWTAAPAQAEGVILSNQTVRMHRRISVGGQNLRVRLSNAHGHRPLPIGEVRIACRASGAATVLGSDRPVSFDEAGAASIAPGALLINDPVALEMAPLSDLPLSIHLPTEIPATSEVTGRYARQTNYVSPPGNFAAAAVMPVGRLCDDRYFLCGVDVMADADAAGIIARGDSLTDANISTLDAFCRWPDQLARRLFARPQGRACGIMNQGLGGNRILHDIRGDSGLRRFDRDVLAQPGITHVSVIAGPSRKQK